MEPKQLKPSDLKLMFEGVNGDINVKHGPGRSISHEVPILCSSNFDIKAFAENPGELACLLNRLWLLKWVHFNQYYHQWLL